MNILSRNANGGFARPDYHEVPELGTMEKAGQANPYSQNFVIPEWLVTKPTPWQLTVYLQQANRQHNHEISITGARLGQAKRILATYRRKDKDEPDLDVICRTIWQLGRTHKKLIDFTLVSYVLKQETEK